MKKNIFTLIEPYKNKGFKWGEHDCVIFSGNVASELSGVELTIISESLGEYDSPKTALRRLKHYGIEKLEDLFDQYFERILPLKAQRGDIVLCEHEGLWNKAFAVVLGVHAVTTSEKGLVKVPMQHWLNGWRVPKCHH